MENFADLVGCIQTENNITFFGRFGVILRRQHYTYGSLRVPFCGYAIEFAVYCRFDQIRQVAVQTTHNRLGFWITKTAVKLNRIGCAALINHQTCVQEASKLMPFRFHTRYGRQNNLVHRALVYGGRYHRRGTVRAHTARIRAFVVV